MPRRATGHTFVRSHTQRAIRLPERMFILPIEKIGIYFHLRHFQAAFSRGYGYWQEISHRALHNFANYAAQHNCATLFRCQCPIFPTARDALNCRHP